MKISNTSIYLLVLLLAGFVHKAFSQEKENDTSINDNKPVIGIEGHQGFIIIHSRSIREVKNSFPYGIGLNINWQDLGEDAWKTCHCYPRTGLDVSYFNFDNRAVLGHGYVFSGFVEPFFQLSKNWALSFKANCGLGYLTNPHDPVDNPDNQSYSVHVNGFLQVNLGINYKITPQWQIALSANYNHISNGGIEKPNKGINYPTVGLGIDYFLSSKDYPDRKKTDSKIPEEQKNQWEINSFLGTKELNNEEESRHWNYGVQAFYNRKLSHLHALRLGGEWVFNNAVKQEMIDQNESISFWQYQRGNILFGHAFLLGKFRFSEQIGAYLYRPYGDEDVLYQRYSLTYQITNSLHTGIGFKAHRHVADFLDVRMSWRF